MGMNCWGMSCNEKMSIRNLYLLPTLEHFFDDIELEKEFRNPRHQLVTFPNPVPEKQ